MRRYVKLYRGDNGVFKSAEFERDLQAQGQEISLPGLGRTTRTELLRRAIRTVTESAKHHATARGHTLARRSHHGLWPFAFDYAIWIWNRLPKPEHRMAPIELFCRTKSESHMLQDARVWGCPAYVLDPLCRMDISFLGGSRRREGDSSSACPSGMRATLA